MVVAESGAGKTGALAALPNAGYELGILDMDGGADILHDYVQPEAMDRVSIVTCQDKAQLIGNELRPLGQPRAWTSMVDALKDWPDYNWGPVHKWPSNRVLVLDSGTKANEAAINYILFLNSKMTRWEASGKGVGLMEGLLGTLNDKSWTCQVVINFHFTVIEDIVSGRSKVLPSVVGKKLPPQAGRSTNNLVTIVEKGGKKFIRTQSEGMFALKVSCPRKVPAEIEMSFDKDGYPTGGLAELFRLLTNSNPKKPE